MKKYYLLYSAVLYCSIDVLGCDCCKKLCGKSGEEGYEKEKSWEESKKTKWQFLERCDIQQEFLKKWNGLLKKKKNANPDDFVPIILEQHDVKAGCGLEAYSDVTQLYAGYDVWLDLLYKYILESYKLKKLALYINGDPNLTYDSDNNALGFKTLNNYVTDFKNESLASSSLEVVFISYYAIRKGCCC